jgi:hypothetical protein
MACFVQDNVTKEVLQATYTAVPLDFPNILLTEFEVIEHIGNGDGRVDPGETGRIILTLENQYPFHDATEVSGQISESDPLIFLTDSLADFPDLPSGGTGANDGDPFEFTVDPSLVAHEVTFAVSISARPGSYQTEFEISFMVGRPDLLLINDDVAGNYQTFYESSLDSLERVHDVWNQFVSGSVPAEEIALYPYVIWYTGSDASAVLDATDQARIEGYLGGGGRLLLSSQNAGDVLGGTPFYENVLHAEHLANSVGLDFPLSGVPDDPVSNGTTLWPIGPGGASNANSCASLNPMAPAVGIYTYNAAGTFAALRCEFTPFKLIYMAFPIEAVSGLQQSTSRMALLQNCLEYLESPAGVEVEFNQALLPGSLKITRLYPNPFNPATEIHFDLPDDGRLSLIAYDLQGKSVATIAEGHWAAGSHSLRWNAATLASGIYWIELESEGRIAVAKALLMK